LAENSIKTGDNMTVKNELVNGNTEIFETDNYTICKPKDFHPMILKVTVYCNGKKIKSVSRRHKWYYKHFTFHTEEVQKKFKEIQASIEATD
jgi:hypothetical protein